MTRGPKHRLAETVLILRTLRWMTTAELAARSDLSEDHVRRIEAAQADIGVGTLAMLAAGLDCDPRDLVRDGGRAAIYSALAETYDTVPTLIEQAILVLLLIPDNPDCPVRLAALATLLKENPMTPPPPARGRPHRKPPDGPKRPGR